MVAVVLALPVIAANMEHDLENDLDHIFAIHHHKVN